MDSVCLQVTRLTACIWLQVCNNVFWTTRVQSFICDHIEFESILHLAGSQCNDPIGPVIDEKHKVWVTTRESVFCMF